MIEGLWSLEFVSEFDYKGAGVVVFNSGKLRGGDSNYFYVGTYLVNGTLLVAQVTTTHYAGEPLSIIGPSNRHSVQMTGTIDINGFMIRGFSTGDNPVEIAARLVKRAEL